MAAYVTLADKLTPGTAKCLTGALKKLRIFQAFLRGAPLAFLFRAWTLPTDSRRHAVIPATNPEIAKAYLARGDVAEAEEKWGLALEHYGIGLSLLPKDTKTGYFLFNNAAHCLNALELYSEGESYCRRAIDIDSTRSELTGIWRFPGVVATNSQAPGVVFSRSYQD